MSYIYKVVSQLEYKGFKEAGVFKGSALDLKDGYIHCSTEEQWPRIREKFFSAGDRLFLLKIDSSSFAEKLRWAPSPRSGVVYPHLYGEIPLESVIEIRELS